jgi:hypothetical protein
MILNLCLIEKSSMEKIYVNVREINYISDLDDWKDSL